MRDKQEEKMEEKIRELEERVERTNENTSALVGALMVTGVAVVSGFSWPLFLLGLPIGAAGGAAWHHLRKRAKNRKTK